MHRRPAGASKAAQKKPAAVKKSGMTHNESEGFGKIRMYQGTGRSYIQMWNEDCSAWKPCLFANSGHNHECKTHYVWERLLAGGHILASLANLKAFFASGKLAVVNGSVVEVKADDDKDADLHFIEGASEQSSEDID